MNEHIFDSMPVSLESHLNLALMSPPLTDADKVKNILQSIQFHDDAVSYSFGEINLNQPFRGYRQFRLLIGINTSHRQLASGYMICKNTQGNYIILELNDSNAVTLMNAFGALVPSRKISYYREPPLEKKLWDNLSFYQTDELTSEFYTRQNKSSAQLIHQNILANKSKKSIVLDLGCGTGNIYEEFSKLRKANEQVHWVGVDYSQANIEEAKSRSGGAATWIQHDATTFIDKLGKETLKNADVYVNASGLMNVQVLSFEQSLQVMQSLQKIDKLKMVFITGLTASYISPYLAKQIGFGRVNSGIAVSEDHCPHEIACYVPQSLSNRINRYIAKALKHGVLDLSYIAAHEIDSVIHEIIKRKDELISVLSLLLAGVPLNSARINALSPLFNQNKNLLVYVAPVNNEQKVSIDLAIRQSPCSFRFLSMDMITAYPLFSPTFYRKLGLSDGNDLPMASTDHYAGFQGLMLEQLFRALNNDIQTTSVLTDDQRAALSVIHCLINHWPAPQDRGNEKKYYSRPLLQAYQNYKALLPSTNSDSLPGHQRMKLIQAQSPGQ